MFVLAWTICTKRTAISNSTQLLVFILLFSAQRTDEEISVYQMEVSSIYHNLQEIDHAIIGSKKSAEFQQIVKNVIICEFT